MSIKSIALGSIIIGMLMHTVGVAANGTFIDTLNRNREVVIGDDALRAASLVVPVTQTKVAPAETIAEDVKRPMVDGFRIQCMATSQNDRALKEKNALEARLKLPVYIMFVAPYYKVLAGDFLTRAKAENIQEQLKKTGYPDAWIASVRVYSSQ